MKTAVGAGSLAGAAGGAGAAAALDLAPLANDERVRPASNLQEDTNTSSIRNALPPSTLQCKIVAASGAFAITQPAQPAAPNAASISRPAKGNHPSRRFGFATGSAEVGVDGAAP